MVSVEVIARLRQMAVAGATPTQILDEALKQTAVEGRSSRLMAIVSFKEAFFLSMVDASLVGACKVFGERLSADEFDEQMAKLIDASRELWFSGSSQ